MSTAWRASNALMPRNSSARVPFGPTFFHDRPPLVVRSTVPPLPLAQTTRRETGLIARRSALPPWCTTCQDGAWWAVAAAGTPASAVSASTAAAPKRPLVGSLRFGEIIPRSGCLHAPALECPNGTSGEDDRRARARRLPQAASGAGCDGVRRERDRPAARDGMVQPLPPSPGRALLRPRRQGRVRGGGRVVRTRTGRRGARRDDHAAALLERRRRRPRAARDRRLRRLRRARRRDGRSRRRGTPAPVLGRRARRHQAARPEVGSGP